VRDGLLQAAVDGSFSQAASEARKTAELKNYPLLLRRYFCKAEASPLTNRQRPARAASRTLPRGSVLKLIFAGFSRYHKEHYLLLLIRSHLSKYLCIVSELTLPAVPT
jgi:hypothetical protein